MIKKRLGPTEPELDVVPIREVDDARSWVFYGRSGTGKTTLASSFPKPILYMDVRDRGTDSISDVDQIFVTDIQSFDKFKEWHTGLTKFEKFRKAPNGRPYRTVVVDTVSQLQSVLVREHAVRNGKSGRTAGNWGTLTKKDWGDIASKLKEALIDYRDLTELGIEVVFIAQDRVFNVEDEDAEDLPPPEVGPALSPSVAKALNASVSVVANTFVRKRVKKIGGKSTTKIEYCLGIGPSEIYTRKVRKPKSDELPDLIVNPDYEEIIAIIKGED